MVTASLQGGVFGLFQAKVLESNLRGDGKAFVIAGDPFQTPTVYFLHKNLYQTFPSLLHINMDIDLRSNTTLAFSLSIKNSPGMMLTGNITGETTKMLVQLSEQLIITGMSAVKNTKLNVEMLYCCPQ